MSSLQQAKDTKTRTFTAILHWEEDVYVAECPEVGTASQGETIEEAIKIIQNLRIENLKPRSPLTPLK
ncbi:type II toxin-antitoxin system HicB family antitoxin [Nostoc sp. CHAB 5784]|uniref:type II toxin-antitoxin system HicB family antitoxin n=1 Tax=Nostoc mirabile TaxID=2907820 RepID=UPI001E2F5FA5|nr:type II toxin-antitoxin system HicB family antitoxin [Nostoc mirabile]MCC5668820.1 type II toxin-antitoxin system HicB family antitoxin [Nostoc mirabile CHAB5784]